MWVRILSMWIGVSNNCRLNHSSGSPLFAFTRDKQANYRKTPAQKLPSVNMQKQDAFENEKLKGSKVYIENHKTVLY